MLAADDPRVVSLAELVRAGDVAGVRALLARHPSLATERFGDAATSRTVLHVATDWPGHPPRVAETIALLVAAGAAVDGRFAGPHSETALHWAASSDDVDAIDALLDAGADIEADGAVLTGGTPLADAVVFAQWNAARRLVQRGATMTVWQAAALGETDELTRVLDAGSFDEGDITNACWHACRAGQLAAVQALVARGADLDRLGHDHLTGRQAGLASGSDDLIAWLRTV
ncbi:MAG: ankyrin repeat domain-containing protein [Actinomycetota bacterium]|nr:ankyrin repeat domain-containing protein [Actinomycetota bacterium]